MLLEGKNAIKEALNNNLTINKIYVDLNYKFRKEEIINLATQKKVKLEFLNKNILDKKSKTGHHQGYIAETVDFQYSSLDEILNIAKKKNEKNFIILLDGIEDPHNLGAIIRSCECAGVHGIIIPKNRACQINETVIRTSTGAISNIMIAKVTNLKDVIKELKQQNIWVYAAEACGENIYKKNLNQNIAIVIGSEGFGIKKSILSCCDSVISLPLMGKINSLNASVACGIVVFETLRQRLGEKNDR